MKRLVLNLVMALFLFIGAGPSVAQKDPGKPSEKPVTEIKLGYLRAYEPQLALSVLDVPPRDEGVAGANVAIADNNTTG
ncbi:MAG TPA: branched-chain amino acid ABC transporter substrate-binding protein, partial [Rhizobiaceae bacterium]|nr:branched-chain amino acid ABC transporter substrate-binding protein [Rhizobiaceae bacterium]